MADSPRDDSLRVPIPPPLIYAAGLVVGAALDRFVPWWWAPRHAPAGVALVLLGFALVGWAALALRRAGTTVLPYGRATYLVPEGPYRFSRNPMYVGMALAYAGVALATGGAWALLLLPLVLLEIHVGVVRREERHLEARFGEAYLAYKRRVRRWL